MYIVGTSGHIDHGKTSLIFSLTSIDTDRLPEEKEREMTIDIGFASIKYPKFGTVSIIDVPGHERFIRNMVVGAWGVDLALLVIAVDDGWMPQTEDHFRVLQILGIERMIVVLNKIDLADEEMVEFVKAEVEEKLSGTLFQGADIAMTSTKTGEGIEDLKTLIVENLRRLSKITKTDKPYLFIDRAFASKGHGTVVTGTQKNGIFNEDDTVHILPIKKDARIKRIETHYSEVEEGNPSQRTALNLSGVSINEIKRGSILFKKNFFTESREIIARIQILDKSKEIKNNLGIEILVGTSDIKGKLIILEEVEEKRVYLARIKIDNKWYFYTGQPFVITNPGGYRVIGGGKVLLSDYSSKLKKAVKENLSVLQNISKPEIIEFNLSVFNWLRRESLISILPDSEKSIDKLIETLEGEKKLVKVKGFLLNSLYYEDSLKSIAGSIKEKVGLNIKELSDSSGISPEICKELMPRVMEDNTIVEKDGRYFSGDSITEETLPKESRKLLDEILKNSTAGIELNKEQNDLRKKTIKELIRMDFLISLDGNIIYHRDIYNSLKEKIMDLFATMEKISISDARDAIDISRKYMLPLLNRIERDGLLKRVGDFRIKA
jgi:selenocysteine-specific elongation factor